MRTFNEREKKFINQLIGIKADNPVLLNELLKSFYFKEELNRALIIQNQGEYAAFFLKTAIFNDEKKRDEEVKSFFELLSLLMYLNREGYITIYRSKTDPMYYIQDDFNAPKIIQNSIILNTKGYITISPDTIHDSNKNVIYKGLVFRADQYHLIMDACTGSLLISKSLKELINNDKSNTKIALSIIIIMLVLSFVVFLHSEIITQKQRISMVESKHDILKSNIDLVSAIIQDVSRSTEIQVEEVELDAWHYGIDISRFNRDEVEKITSNDSIKFIFCKATEGISYIDPYFFYNWRIIRANNYILGAYHFYCTNDNPVVQADFFWKTILDQGKPDIAPVVDIEQESLPPNADHNPNEIQANFLKFLKRLEEHSKRPPIIYTNRSFGDKYLLNEDFAKYPLWIAEYSNANTPHLPKAWIDVGYKIWQKKNNYSIDSHLTDFDEFYGKLSDLIEQW
jgi:lysozyme